MSKCWNCEIEITLKDEEVVCDACKEIVRWWCCNCGKPFDIQDEETKKKLKECKACGFFECPSCGLCGTNCPKICWGLKLKEISPTLNEEQIKMMVDYFEIIKLGKEKRNCEFGVPISYAKGKIKSALSKLEGFKTKGESDIAVFNKRMEKLLDKDLNFEFTVNIARENGSYGQEYRDIFNLGICLGKVETIKKKSKGKKEYMIFRRCENGECPYFDKEKLLVNICIKCGKEFSKEIKCCDTCKYKKGEKKGKFIETNIKISNKDTCQLPRGEFITKEEMSEEEK